VHFKINASLPADMVDKTLESGETKHKLANTPGKELLFKKARQGQTEILLNLTNEPHRVR
jgi:hypothetical protein